MLRLAPGCQPSLDGALAHADFTGDPARGHAVGLQLADRGIALGAGLSALVPQLVDAWMAHRHLVQTRLLGPASLDAARGRHGAAMPAHGGPERVTEVVEQVPAVGRLRGPGSAVPNGPGEDRGAVARDDRHARMSLQPRRHGAGLAVGQEVQHAPLLEIT